MDVVPFLIDHLNDNTEIRRGSYDESGKVKVGGVFFSIAVKLNPLSVLNVEKFNASQRAILFNALLATPNKLSATARFIIQAEKRPELYQKLRNAIDLYQKEAVFYKLAKYRKPEDVELILDYLLYDGHKKGNQLSQKIIQIFTNDELFKTFNETKKSRAFRASTLKNLFNALVKQLDNDAILSLNTQLNETEELNIQKKMQYKRLLFDAINKLSNGKGTELLWFFWEKENRIQRINYDYLVQQDPERALELTKSNLRNLEQFYTDNKSQTNYMGIFAIKMVGFVLNQDRKSGIELVKYNIVTPAQPLHTFFGRCIRKTIELQDKQFIDLLLPMLENDYHYFVHHAVLVLLSFDDDELDKIIAQSLNENRSQRTTENWKWLYERFEATGILEGKPNNIGKLGARFRL